MANTLWAVPKVQLIGTVHGVLIFRALWHPLSPNSLHWCQKWDIRGAGRKWFERNERHDTHYPNESECSDCVAITLCVFAFKVEFTSHFWSKFTPLSSLWKCIPVHTSLFQGPPLIHQHLSWPHTIVPSDFWYQCSKFGMTGATTFWSAINNGRKVFLVIWKCKIPFPEVSYYNYMFF